MEFEWDENKRLKVRRDRGLDFAEATDVFDGRAVVTIASPRGTEDRWLNIAEIEGVLITVVWCRRGDNVRIITMRRSNNAETRKYRELYNG